MLRGFGAGLSGVALAAVCGAARAEKVSDWPCVQPFVATLTTATYWSAAPAPPQLDWRQQPQVTAIVEATASRDVPVADAQARLAGFADTVAPRERPRVLAEVFQGLVDETNLQRGRLMARIRELARRQRDLSQVATRLAAELRDAPADKAVTDELAQRRDFATRAFQDAQRTMRYACEVPPALDARLGQFARTLQGKLDD